MIIRDMLALVCLSLFHLYTNSCSNVVIFSNWSHTVFSGDELLVFVVDECRSVLSKVLFQNNQHFIIINEGCLDIC